MSDGSTESKPKQKGWAKGVSGNPGGRPKLAANARELASMHIEDAIRTLSDIMHNAAKDADRSAAACALLDRAVGRPAQMLDVTHRDDGADEADATLRRLQSDPLAAAALLTLAELSAKAD